MAAIHTNGGSQPQVGGIQKTNNFPLAFDKDMDDFTARDYQVCHIIYFTMQ